MFPAEFKVAFQSTSRKALQQRPMACVPVSPSHLVTELQLLPRSVWGFSAVGDPRATVPKAHGTREAGGKKGLDAKALQAAPGTRMLSGGGARSGRSWKHSRCPQYFSNHLTTSKETCPLGTAVFSHDGEHRRSELSLVFSITTLTHHGGSTLLT